jgi:hypothetical protein
MVVFHSYVRFIDDLPMKNGWIFHSYGSKTIINHPPNHHFIDVPLEIPLEIVDLLIKHGDFP